MNVTENQIMRHYVKVKLRNSAKDLLKEIEIKRLHFMDNNDNSCLGDSFISIELVQSLCSILEDDSIENINLLSSKRYSPVTPFKFGFIDSIDYESNNNNNDEYINIYNKNSSNIISFNISNTAEPNDRPRHKHQ